MTGSIEIGEFSKENYRGTSQVNAVLINHRADQALSHATDDTNVDRLSVKSLLGRQLSNGFRVGTFLILLILICPKAFSAGSPKKSASQLVRSSASETKVFEKQTRDVDAKLGPQKSRKQRKLEMQDAHVQYLKAMISKGSVTI